MHRKLQKVKLHSEVSDMIDIILIALVVLITLLAVRKGFVRTVFELFSGLFAFIIARMLASPVASALYTASVQKIVLQFLAEKYQVCEEHLTAHFRLSFAK